MTPEQMQQKIDFILESHSRFVERLDADFATSRQEMSDFRQSLVHQKENIDALMRIAQDVLKISQVHLERTKRLEGRVESVEEMTRILRELLEANLRRPDKQGSPES